MEEQNVTVTEQVETKVSKKANKTERDKYELHEILWIVAIISAVVSFLVALIAQACINGDGYYALQIFGMKKPLKMEFITTQLTSIIAGVLAIISIGCGVTRNLLKRVKTPISYIPGVVTLILAVIAFLAGIFA